MVIPWKKPRIFMETSWDVMVVFGGIPTDFPTVLFAEFGPKAVALQLRLWPENSDRRSEWGWLDDSDGWYRKTVKIQQYIYT